MSAEAAAWATKLFDPSLGHQKMSISDVARVLSQSDGCPKSVRTMASRWSENGAPKGLSAEQVGDRNFIEAVYGNYSAIVDGHQRDIGKLAELRSRANGSFSSYLKLIRSSSLRNTIQDIAKSAFEGLNKLDPDTFLDDIMTLSRGPALRAQAELIVGVWTDAKYAASHVTDAARTLRRHSFLALYQDDNGAAGIETNVTEEDELFRLFCEKYSEEAGPLRQYLNPLVEIVCSLRGYKANVHHVTVLQAGAATFPNSREVNS